MTRRAFQFWVAAIAGLYALFIITGIALYGGEHYSLFKDLMPLATVLPAAMLAGIYQRRSSFLQQLRGTWISLVDAVQDTLQFTHLTQPEPPDFAKLMKKLSVVTDDFRSLYRNLREGKGSRGFYPFESLKQIQYTISKYYLAKDYSWATQCDTRKVVIDLWQQVRNPVLEEFDRLEPTYFDSPFVGASATAQQGAPGRAASGTPLSTDVVRQNMTTEEKALRELRLDEIQRGIQTRKFGLRAMKRTLLLTVLYGAITVLDYGPFYEILLFCGLLAIIFTLIEEHDTHMKAHLSDILEFVRLTNEKQKGD